MSPAHGVGPSTATADRLPAFPWDSLAETAELARAHPDGIVDLSVGTPVDAVPDPVRLALAGPAAERPGYPLTWGTPELRETVVAAMRRRFGVCHLLPDAVLPTVGSKEFVAWLPTLLGLGPDDMVVLPELAYPTYEVGARLAGARYRTADPSAGIPTDAGPVRLLWLNSPSNPTGRVLRAEQLREIVALARGRGAVVASDECYLSLADPEAGAVSVLHESVSGGDLTGLLAVHSLSKSSNLAGYRAGFVAGDPALVAALLQVRKHAGMMVPFPVQAAMTAALGDDGHVRRQWARYRERRTALAAALRGFGLRIEHSEAGLYLWATGAEHCRVTVHRLAERGVLVAPGEFYGAAGARHVRVAATASDERVAAAVARLTS